jgi:protein SCO1/2
MALPSRDHPPSQNSYWLRLVGIPAIALLVAATIWIGMSRFAPSAAPELRSGILFPQARPIADFKLTFENGETFTRKDLSGHWTALFPGYTHCPDVCPAALAQLKAAKAIMGSDAEKLTILFLSVDPERDTPEHLGDYVRYFDPSFRAATGSEDQINAFAASLFIVHMKTPNPVSLSQPAPRPPDGVAPQSGESGAKHASRNPAFAPEGEESKHSLRDLRKNETPGGYEIGHSAELMLIDPKGRHAGFLRPPFTPEALAADLETVLRSRVP